MVVLILGADGHPAHRFDPVEECGEPDRSAQRPVAAFPAIEIGKCLIYLIVGQHSHICDGIPFPTVSEQLSKLMVVAGALIRDGALLVAQRERPPELAGLWELPGGKVASGETDAAALTRELREELGIGVVVGPRLGADVALSASATLRAYVVTQVDGMLRPNDHRALRWVGVADLAELPWVPADTAWLPELTELLR